MIHSINVSIVIPCYNVEKYIRNCVISCRNQTHRNLEIICVDNNSSDNTAKQLEFLTEEFGIIHLTEQTRGACAARNKGLKNVTSKYVQFLDADDLLLPTKIQTQLHLLEKENADLIVSNYLYQTINKKNNKHEVNKDFLKGLFTTTLGITSANLFKTENVKSIAGWDENLTSSQEYDLMFRLIKNNCTPIICSEYETIVREREEGAISQSDPIKKWKNYIKLRAEILSWMKEHQSAYLKTDFDFYSNKMFEYILILYTYNKNESIKTWLHYKPKFAIRPKSQIKKALLSLLGFDKYCAVINILKK